jgi:glycosyltransferase involved in cell wall biosynthesis
LRAAVERLQPGIVQLGLASHVVLPGAVGYGERLFEYLDHADLFVLPSLTEGMPRSLIEAMARGLPALGSRVGGIPELLEDSQLVTPGAAGELARRIEERMADPKLLARESARNFQRATSGFSIALMASRKNEFWNRVASTAAGRRAA